MRGQITVIRCWNDDARETECGGDGDEDLSDNGGEGVVCGDDGNEDYVGDAAQHARRQVVEAELVLAGSGGTFACRTREVVVVVIGCAVFRIILFLFLDRKSV